LWTGTASPDYDIITTDTQGGFVKVCADLAGFGALDGDGKVYMFGREVSDPPDGLPPIVDIAMGNFHVVALDRGGRVYAWGSMREAGYDFGQTDFPEGLPPIKAVAAGGYKTMLLTFDGRVLSFGDTNLGWQEHVPDLPRIVAIACSAYTSLALDADGYVHAWGLEYPSTKVIGPNVTGMAAVNYDFVYLGASGRIVEDRNLSVYSGIGELSYRPFAELTNIKKLAGSSQNYAAIDYQGSVVIWGYYSFDPGDYNPLVNHPSDLPPIKDIAFTNESAIALGVDGHIYEWGSIRMGWHGPAIDTTDATDSEWSLSVPEQTDSATDNAADNEISPEAEYVDETDGVPVDFTWRFYLMGIALVLFVLTSRAVQMGRAKRAKRKKTTAAANGSQASEDILSGIADHLASLRKLDKAGQGKLEGPVRDILSATEQIIGQLSKHPASTSEIRQFLNYTLPTTINLLQHYDEFSRQAVKGKNIVAAMGKIEGMMDTIVGAFHRQLDALFRDKALEIDMELDVMKNMLRDCQEIGK